VSSIDRRVTWVGTVLLLCFVLLFVQMNNLQVREAAAVKGNPYFRQTSPSKRPTSVFFEPRGEIISADGVVLAYSRKTNDAYKYLRIYPKATARMFSDITGYYANSVQAVQFGVEASYNTYLEEHPVKPGSLGAVLGQHDETENVHLTLSETLQAAAMKALGSSSARNGGSIVVLDPQTGAVLAMYGYPNYNPNTFAVHDPAAVNKLAARDSSLEFNPTTNFSISEPEPPGSTMKVVTTAAVFDHDSAIEHQYFKAVSSITFPNSPGSQRLQNYAGELCPAGGGYLPEILSQSCDTAYAEIGDELGYQRFSEEAQAFGFGIGLYSQSGCSGLPDRPPIDLPDACPSYLPPPGTIDGSNPFIGYSAIGQFDDGATVLEMALVAAGIADNGIIMAPHVVDRAVNQYGATEFTYHPHVWRKATSPGTAEQVRQLMTGVTLTPGATAHMLFAGWYADGGPTIAAKTGTAEPGSNTCGTENWLIALGPAAQGQTPTVAVAAMLPVTQAECQTFGYSPTGASVAGPVLLPVLLAALRLQGSASP
jgi:peptidoglycan glycosyltransferase